MKRCVLLVLMCACAYGAPASPLKAGSCQDPSTLGAADLALTKINEARREGYVFSLNRLCNVNQMQHGPMGVVFYLTLDVLETRCHVLSRKDWKSCEVREELPVYGQCKATIYINKVQRVVRLYSFSCTVRPAPASKIHQICPDCPSLVPLDDTNVSKAVKESLEKYNNISEQANYFGLLNVTRASFQGGFGRFYFVEFTIQETVCSNSTDVTEAAKCELMECEFAHKGHCKGSHIQSRGEEHITVTCDIFESPDAEKEKQRHLLGGEHGHSHEHGDGHDHKHDHEHDHKHDHTHNHTDHHHHHHEHGPGHNHTHQHKHLHPHEHHHHHHDHDHKKPTKAPQGVVHYLPAVDQPMTIPSFHDHPAASEPHHPVTLPVFPDTEESEKEPAIQPFPSTISKQCPAESKSQSIFIKELFAQDPLFQHKQHK